MFRTLALVAIVSALTMASASAQPLKMGMTIAGYGTHSVQVQEVYSGSVAEQMGIRSGDVIYGINGGWTNDPFAFRDAVFASDRVTLNIQRGNRLYMKWVQFNTIPQRNMELAVATCQMVEITK